MDKVRRAGKWIVGVVGAGIAADAFSKLSALVVTFLGGMSEQFQAHAYRLAAMEPQVTIAAIPTRMTVMLMMLVAGSISFALMIQNRRMRLEVEDIDITIHSAGRPPLAKSPPTPSDIAMRTQALRKSIRNDRFMIAAIMGMTLFWLFSVQREVLLQDSALAVWREFQVDLSRCGPVLNPAAQARLRADFSSMSRKSDWINVKKQLQDVASKAKIKSCP